MKKVIILAVSLVLSMVGFSQSYSGNVITTNTIFHGGGWGTITVKSGATLKFSGDATIDGGGLVIEAGATVISDYKLTLNGSNSFSGTLQVGTIHINGGTNTLAGCAFINTGILEVVSDNTFTGMGLIYITGTFSNSYQDKFYTGHPLSNSSDVYVNTSNTLASIGIAQYSTQTSSPCSITTPVTFSTSPKVTAIYETYVTVEFKVANESQIARYNVQFSRDGGKTWETVAVVIPNNTTLNKTYSVNVNLYK